MSDTIQTFIREQVEMVACNTLPDIFKENESAITQHVLSSIGRIEDKEIVRAIITLVQNLKITKADIEVETIKGNVEVTEQATGEGEEEEEEVTGGSKKKRRKFNKTKRKKRKNKN